MPIIDGESLVEISGAVLATDDGTGPSLWVHQDSGQPAQLHRIGLDGTILDAVSVTNRSPFDWEDIAAAVDRDGVRHLFVADIGDNRRAREQVEIHRLIEPVFGAREARADTIVLSLPHGARDAEALVVDGSTGTLIVLTKSITGVSDVLVAEDAAWLADGTSVDLVQAGTLSLGVGQAVLAADLSPDRSILGVRTPSRVMLWALDPNRALTEALTADTPCRAPAPFDIFGEALALTDQGYLLLGESDTPALQIGDRR